MKLSRYTLIARLFPAIICSVPFLVLYFFFLNSYLQGFFKSLISIQWPGDVSTVLVFLFLMAIVGRTISKDIFEKFIFSRDETRMPTTEFLLHLDSEYTAELKAHVHSKISADFSIQILSAAEELVNAGRARKVIAEAVSLIRYKVGNGKLLYQHNIEYGFIRNLIGCSVIAVIVSVVDVVIFSAYTHNYVALSTALVMTVLYVLPIVLGSVLIRNYGKRYARILIQEYLSISKV